MEELSEIPDSVTVIKKQKHVLNSNNTNTDSDELHKHFASGPFGIKGS